METIYVDFQVGKKRNNAAVEIFNHGDFGGGLNFLISEHPLFQRGEFHYRTSQYIEKQIREQGFSSMSPITVNLETYSIGHTVVNFNFKFNEDGTLCKNEGFYAYTSEFSYVNPTRGYNYWLSLSEALMKNEKIPQQTREYIERTRAFDLEKYFTDLLARLQKRDGKKVTLERYFSCSHRPVIEREFGFHSSKKK